MEPMEPSMDLPLVGAGSGVRRGGVGWGGEVVHQGGNTVLQDLYSIGAVHSF